jgi:protein-S-isoprenylcysteine O-methyltransferase Ste14
MDETVGMIATILIFVVVFGFAAFIRFLQHKETLVLAEKGLVHPKKTIRNGNGKGALRWGIIIAAVGLAIIIGIFPMALKSNWPLLLTGLLPTFFGLGLVLVYIVTQENGGQPENVKHPNNSELIDEG